MAQYTSNIFSVTVKPIPAPSGLPAWVPPVGFFADVPMINRPIDVTPAVYAQSSLGLDSPFVNWGGSAVLRDFSALGAQVYYASGHEASAATLNIQCTLICDFSSLMWSTANAPAVGNSGGSADANGAYADGTVYAPHTYLGLQELPRAWGGGSRGSLASFFWAGAPYSNRINLLDVSKATFGYSQLTTRQAENSDPSTIRFTRNGGDKGSYPITVMDNARQGWWAMTSGSTDYTLFISKTGDVTQYPALGGNLANGTMVLCPKLNLLIAIDGGYNAGPYAGKGYRSLYIRDLASGATSTSLTAGTVPSVGDGYDGSSGTYNRPDMLGLQWVDELGCIVGFDDTTSPPTIVKLTPPASNPASAPWTWSKVSVLHWPSDTGGSSTLKAARSGMWSKFRWIPSLQGFVFCTAKDSRPQIVRIS